jgi:hypothetical protein
MDRYSVTWCENYDYDSCGCNDDDDGGGGGDNVSRCMNFIKQQSSVRTHNNNVWLAKHLK